MISLYPPPNLFTPPSLFSMLAALDVLATIVLLILGTVVLVNTFYQFYLKLKLQKSSQSSPRVTPRVTIVIPARDEQDKIANCIESCLHQSYSNFSVIVVDDNSSDNTATIASQFNEVEVIAGATLPPGWLGKNWALAQAIKSEQVKSAELLLFIDADVQLQTRAIERAVGLIQADKLDLVTVFPKQNLRSLGEWLTVTYMNLILLIALPLPLAQFTRSDQFATANGQFMLVRNSIYKTIGGHEAVKSDAAEDIALARLVKRAGGSQAVLVDQQLAVTRMYTTYTAGVAGFAKNAQAAVTRNSAVYFLFITLIVFALSWPLVRLDWLNILIIVGIRMITSLISSQNPLINIVLHIPQILTIYLIGLCSLAFNRGGKLNWKGREIN